MCFLSLLVTFSILEGSHRSRHSNTYPLYSKDEIFPSGVEVCVCVCMCMFINLPYVQAKAKSTKAPSHSQGRTLFTSRDACLVAFDVHERSKCESSHVSMPGRGLPICKVLTSSKAGVGETQNSGQVLLQGAAAAGCCYAGC